MLGREQQVCLGVVPTATFQAKSWVVLLPGNGWDDCWVYEC